MQYAPWKHIDSVWSLGINHVWLFTCPSSLFFWLPHCLPSEVHRDVAPGIHSQLPKSTASCPGCLSLEQRSSEQRLSKAVLSLGDENVEGVGNTSAKQNLRP